MQNNNLNKNIPEWHNHAKNELKKRLNDTHHHIPGDNWLDDTTHEQDEIDKYNDNWNARLAHYSDENTIGCGTTNYDDGNNYPFLHTKFIWDKPTSQDDPKKLKAVKLKTINNNPNLLVVAIPHPNYNSFETLPATELLSSNYKLQIWHLLRAHSDLGTGLLIIQGDGKGSFLNRYNGKYRNTTDVISAQAILDKTLIDTIEEFFYTNQNSGIQKIIIPTYRASATASDQEDQLVTLITGYTAKYNGKSNFPTITHEVLTPDTQQFFTDKYHQDHPSLKIGITSAPHHNNLFQGAALIGRGALALEETMALTSDMSTIGAPILNPNIKQPIDHQQSKINTPTWLDDALKTYKDTISTINANKKAKTQQKSTRSVQRHGKKSAIPQPTKTTPLIRSEAAKPDSSQESTSHTSAQHHGQTGAIPKPTQTTPSIRSEAAKAPATTYRNIKIMSAGTLSLLSAALATYICTTQIIKSPEPLSATRISVSTTLIVALAIASIALAALSYNTYKNKPKAQSVEVERVDLLKNTEPTPTV